MEPAPGDVGTNMGATAMPSPLTGMKGMTAQEHIQALQEARQRFKEGRRDTSLDKSVSLPVKERLAGKGLPLTPPNILQASQELAQEKQANDIEQIQMKERMQQGSAKVKDFLMARHGVNNYVDATPDQVQDAINAEVDQRVDEHARNIMNQFNLGGLEAGEKERLNGFQEMARVTDRLRNEFTPAERRKYAGYLNLGTNRIAQFVRDDPKFAQFDALVNREGIAAFATAGKTLTEQESNIIFGFLANGKEWGHINLEAKLKEADDYARKRIGDIVTTATTNRRDLAKKIESTLPKQEPKKTAAARYNELEKQGLPEDQIYKQLSVEGYQ